MFRQQRRGVQHTLRGDSANSAHLASPPKPPHRISMANNNFEIEPLKLSGAAIISPPTYPDGRGYFAVPFNREALKSAGIDADFIQDNQSLSEQVGTLRGLHYQLPPFSQAKLVRVLAGRILDVMVDARLGSPTFGQHCQVELSAENAKQVFVPRGFVHGFVTREPNTIVMYKVDNQYSLGGDRSVAWNDPDLGIDWGLDETAPVLSDKDKNAQSWDALASAAPFRYEDA
jgi:dTDP-4-dehydrorhamnose 3,5-epimerase